MATGSRQSLGAGLVVVGLGGDVGETGHTAQGPGGLAHVEGEGASVLEGRCDLVGRSSVHTFLHEQVAALEVSTRTWTPVLPMPRRLRDDEDVAAARSTVHSTVTRCVSSHRARAPGATPKRSTGRPTKATSSTTNFFQLLLLCAVTSCSSVLVLSR